MKVLTYNGKIVAVARDGYEWEMINPYHRNNLTYYIVNGKINHYSSERYFLLSLGLIVTLISVILCLMF